MKVAMVSEHASPLATLGGVDAGGQNVHVAALSKALARTGTQIVVYTRRDDRNLPAQVEQGPGVVVDHIDAGPAEALPKDELLQYMDLFAEQLRRRWQRNRPDVVHAHFWMSAYAALAAAQPLGIPVVQTFHALGVVKRRYQGSKDTSPPERSEIERNVIRRVDHIIATCTDEVFELLRLKASGKRLSVIPCGVDLNLFKSQGPADSKPPGRKRLLCIGRLVKRKGIGNVITALSRLPEAELVVVGGPEHSQLSEDPEVNRLRGLAKELGVEDRLQLRGRVARNELPALIRSADTVVCVPWYEPFGIVPLEAMACGIPVVASAVGGMIDTVVDGRTGIHVPPNEPERLAEALQALLASEERRRSYGQAGIERARRLYDWNNIAGSTLDVYQRVVRASSVSLKTNFKPLKILPGPKPEDHLGALTEGISKLRENTNQIESWATQLAERLKAGSRLLVCGNGGSAAEAQHLSAELVGRFCSERQPLSALCLHADSSSVTAIANDYGVDEIYARQVRAHARLGDILLMLSTSGESPNLINAATTATDIGIETWSLTGPGPNPLQQACDEAICIEGRSPATVQELHLVAIHLLCIAVDHQIAGQPRSHLTVAKATS